VDALRILLVDDFEPYRRFVLSELQPAPEFEVVGHASDGLQAVQRAEELQPDLILLDVGLPVLNGIEAGQRIRQVSPHSKILFISQDSSPDVVEEALRLGAQGYVLKSDAARELLSAIRAIREGKQFVSRRLEAEITLAKAP
jgi:DNA-binding NarL/FixJ family response regulator